MCLDLTIELPLEASKGFMSARRLSQETGLHVTSYRTEEGSRGFPFAALPGCSCSPFHESFEIHAASWPLEAGVGPALAKAVALVAQKCPSFSLSSTYLGSEDRPPRRVAVLSELLTELSANRLSAHVIREVNAAV
jgi:hypothetical protein